MHLVFFFYCMPGGIPEHVLLSLPPCLSFSPEALRRGELRVHMGVGVLVLGGWVGDYSFNELRPGKERGEKARLTSLTISIRLHFLLKANSSVLAWRWIAALELRFNQ